MNWIVGLVVLFYILYWPLISNLLDAILERPRLKRVHWFFVGAVNAVLVWGVFPLTGNVISSYFIMVTLLLVALCVFYRDRFSSALLCTLACSIHVLSALMLCASAIAAATDYTPHEILTTGRLVVITVALAFASLDIMVWVVTKLIPLSHVKLINQHQEQQWFIIAWMFINNAFLIYVAALFCDPAYPAQLSVYQAAAAVTSLVGLYIILFFSIKTSAILGYKEKSEALEQAILQEQQYRNSIVKDALASYEINMTQDHIIKGFEAQRQELGSMVDCYSDMLTFMSHKILHSEDVDNFVRSYSRANILKLFERGHSELTAEYRRLTETGEYIWVRAMANLVSDVEKGDVKAFVRVKNIDAEKKKQLELQYLAERDPLTGLYNKNTVAKLVEEHLLAGKNQKSSAFFIIDVDDFKEINDRLGHVFGDAVLCELGEKLVSIFRSNDLVGRIGGDEFIVFMKDVSTVQKAEEKAAEICKAFHVTYQGPNGEEWSISSSVGIAFSAEGHNFVDLYTHADTALYEAKSKGKNFYQVYTGCDFKGYISQRTEIEARGSLVQKGFRQNRIEYIFKILYHSDDPVAAIHSALELVTSHFSFERGYIFETSKDGKTTSNTFEWCAEGVPPQIGNLQNVPVEAVSNAHSSFCKTGIYVLKSMDDAAPMERAVLEPQGIQSMFQFGIFDKGQLLGFIGFDNRRGESILSDMELDEITTICNILATFFVKHHIDVAASNEILARQEVMNHLDSYIYVIHSETFEVLFMNEKIHDLVKEEPEHVACYSFFRGNTEQCADCPVHKLREVGKERFVQEVYNEKLNIWMEVAASTLRWTDGSLAWLMNCMDITKQKEMRLQHIRQLENLAYVDELTGYRSYYKFKEEAQYILERECDLRHLLVKMDVDNFRLINQIYGYEKGNDILRCVAKAIDQTTRTPNEIFARVANDEFIILFTIRDNAEIDLLNQMFLRNFYACVESNFTFKFRFPHGRFVIVPEDARKTDVNTLFEKVNIAHKAAKLDKTVESVYYDERMTQEELRVKLIENKMAEALANNEFAVYLQPKYILDQEIIGGAEALTRWETKNADLFLPSAFIPIFERNGFIVKLDFYIFKQVCQIVKGWLDDGIEPVVVSVNFSRLHLGNSNFVEELCKIVDEVGVDRGYFEIEITETVIYDNIDTLEVLLNEIHQHGFSMSMDDFGSGYSSLGMLKNLPVDIIKMDRSFFANQRNAERSKIVVGSVIQMASELGIRTVAEGVEEQEHIDFLRELHCDMVQGYYFSRPTPAERFSKLLSQQKRENPQ